MRYHWRAFHFIKYSHNLLWMIYKALPETRCCATVLWMFWRLQLEAKEQCWLYFVLWQLANFCQHYCTKRTASMQSQWFHCSTSKPDDCWHFRASKLNSQISDLLWNYFWCLLPLFRGIDFYPADFQNTALSLTDSRPTLFIKWKWTVKKCVLAYWSGNIVSRWGCWTVFALNFSPVWNLSFQVTLTCCVWLNHLINFFF